MKALLLVALLSGSSPVLALLPVHGLQKTAVELYNRAVSDPYLSPEARLNLYEQALILNPLFQQVYVNRAGILLSLGKQDQALEEITQALKLDPRDALAWNNRAGIYELMGDFNRAIRNYERAVILDPFLIQPLMGIARCQEKLSQYPEAIESFGRVLRLNPNEVEAHQERALLYLKTLDPDHAMSEASAVLELDPDNSEMRSVAQSASELRAILNSPKKTHAKKIQFIRTLQGE